ncbi:hypothetical protein JCM11491_005068 [Sporobolomyces phaffii]
MSAKDQAFLEIGRHCSEQSCRQLDFLPFKCPSCSLPFCASHWRPPSGHSCPSYNPSQFDNRVPSCPLCSSPVPSASASADPNFAMDAHLERDCVVLHPERGSSTSKTRDNVCRASKCRTKLIVEMKCDRCGGKFCPTHRYATDHNCPGQGANGMQEQAEPGRKGFGAASSWFGKKASEPTGLKKAPTPRTKTTTFTTASPRDRLDGMGQAGLAALRRAQQQAATHLHSATTSSAAAPRTNAASSRQKPTGEDDSDSSVEIISSKPTSPPSSKPNPLPRPPPKGNPARAPAPPPPKTTKAASKRAQAEQVSARKALDARYAKGLLSETEKLRYAEMRAEEAKTGRGEGSSSSKSGGKDKDGCVVA